MYVVGPFQSVTVLIYCDIGDFVLGGERKGGRDAPLNVNHKASYNILDYCQYALSCAKSYLANITECRSAQIQQKIIFSALYYHSFF